MKMRNLIITITVLVGMVFAASKTTSKMGSPSAAPQSDREFQYETRIKWNKGVDDFDTLFNITGGLAADSIYKTKAVFDTLDITEDLTSTFITIDSAWDDLRFPATQAKKNPVTDKPDFDFDNVGYLFPQNDAEEIIYIIAQMPHSWAAGTEIVPHIHWKQDTSVHPTWVMAYKWFNIGVDPDTVDWDTITTSTGSITYDTLAIHQLSAFDRIDGTSKTNSSIISIKVWRDDNDMTGDALFYEFDIHYKRNKFGTRTET